VPAAAAALPVKVRVPEGPPLSGVNVPVTPVGSPVTVTLSVPEGPVTITASVTGTPSCATVTLVPLSVADNVAEVPVAELLVHPAAASANPAAAMPTTKRSDRGMDCMSGSHRLNLVALSVRLSQNRGTLQPIIRARQLTQRLPQSHDSPGPNWP